MIKNSAIPLFVVWCWIVPAVVAQEKPVAPNDSLPSLASDFWQWRARYQPFSRDDIPRIDRPVGPRDWSTASIARQRAALKDYETRWKRLNTQGWMPGDAPASSTSLTRDDNPLFFAGRPRLSAANEMTESIMPSARRGERKRSTW